MYIHMRRRKNAHKTKNGFIDEQDEWLHMTPAQRMLGTTKLWQVYFALGGNLDPEPNPQSPFYFQET
jgi:hypothetical protein